MTRQIAALYVETNGCYFGLDGVDPWDEQRDARGYQGPHPVVAHPPCNLWVNLAALNYKRWGGEHNRPGNDGGCFSHSISSPGPNHPRSWHLGNARHRGWRGTGGAVVSELCPRCAEAKAEVGETVWCSVCPRAKSPVGRSAPMESCLCNHECPGYYQDPQPSSLWHGESRLDFGYGGVMTEPCTCKTEPCVSCCVCGLGEDCSTCSGLSCAEDCEA